MTVMDQAFLKGLSWTDLKAVAKVSHPQDVVVKPTPTTTPQENGVKANLKRETMIEELLKVRKPRLLELAKQRGDTQAIKIEKVKRRTVGGAATPGRTRTGEGSRKVAQAVEAGSPTKSKSKAKAKAKVTATITAEASEELRPLDKARARLRAQRANEEKEKENNVASNKEDVVGPSGRQGMEALGGVSVESTDPATIPVSPAQDTAKELEPVREDTDMNANASGYHLRSQAGRSKRVLVPMGEPSVAIKTKRTTRDQSRAILDDRRVGLLSPGPSDQRPVFSRPTPTKPTDTTESSSIGGADGAGRNDFSRSGLALGNGDMQASAENSKEDEGEEADLAEEEEVYEMTSMDNIVIGLEDDDNSVRAVEDKQAIGKGKRKAETEESPVTLVGSPKVAKRRRTSFAPWLFTAMP
ncbi:hypothetical protein BD309DRAFT_1058180 [Dichomitus squalens]|uniref:Uncharacterized protein n=1 Tax=Dichomitus squalens TaxID=114155 RepID=A0A4Q9NDB8_9APHY|nr:hypothetical protein BD309DRAFT_1058180 [Dichomitus squalens]TBU59647.1 hypothetical protein BD310DRAFT_816961 [Dichomitus squalens]